MESEKTAQKEERKRARPTAEKRAKQKRDRKRNSRINCSLYKLNVNDEYNNRFGRAMLTLVMLKRIFSAVFGCY